MEWIEQMFRAMQRELIPLYARVSVDQARLADRQVYVLLAQATRNGIVADSAGIRSLDAALCRLKDSAEVTNFRQPLPRPNPSSGSGRAPGNNARPVTIP